MEGTARARAVPAAGRASLASGGARRHRHAASSKPRPSKPSAVAANNGRIWRSRVRTGAVSSGLAGGSGQDTADVGEGTAPTATASAVGDVCVDLGPGECLIFARAFDLGGHSMSVSVVGAKAPGGSDLMRPRRVTLASAHPGSLLLHWGVVSSRRSGWFLPPKASQPEGTRNYKKRALQTPWRATSAPGGARAQELTLTLPDGADYAFLDFVIKDTRAGAWYNFAEDANFRVPLNLSEARGAYAAGVAPALTAAAATGSAASAAPASEAPRAIPSRPPAIPQELCGIWAYIKWEMAGCPERSQADADAEFAAGVAELTHLLASGVPLDRLWRVARGEIKLRQFYAEEAALASPASPASTPRTDDVASHVVEENIPQELVNVQAYVMWEQAGKPDGADFGAQAKEAIRAKLKAGATVAEVERALRETPDASPAPPPTAPTADDVASDVAIPEELVAVQAYVLWERAGKPDGVDFGNEARVAIGAMLASGMSLADIDVKLREPPSQSAPRDASPPPQTPPPTPPQTQQQQQQEEAAPTPPPPPSPSPSPAREPAEVTVGETRGAGGAYDVLTWIKPKDNPAPNLAKEAATEERKASPLAPLVEAATDGVGVQWKRVYQVSSLSFPFLIPFALTDTRTAREPREPTRCGSGGE